MQVIEKVISMKKYADDQRKRDKTIGFVSTLGYLDGSHIAMIERSKRENDVTIISVFVNIAQFQSSEEYKKYPRDFERDYKLSEEAGADVMFFPEVFDIYNADSCVYVDIEGSLAGTRSRGIATALAKMLNIIQPNRLYLTQKNFREAAVAQQMISDLYMDVILIACPIKREPDGLATSYKNELLSPAEREQAPMLNMALEYARMELEHGERNAAHLKRLITTYLSDATLGKVDYVSITAYDCYKETVQIKGRTVIEIGVQFPSALLEDNLIVNV